MLGPVISRLFFSGILLMAGIAAYAKDLPSYRMDSLALLSDVIVFCDEKDVQFEQIKNGEGTKTKTLVSCKVIRSFKGDLQAGFEFPVIYDSLFRRCLAFKDGYYAVDASGKEAIVVPPEYLPPGRALLFLKKAKDSPSLSVVTAKLIQKDAIFQFGQFESNPGSYLLGPQKPENLKISANQKYGEPQLMEDLLIALKKATYLKNPVPLHSWDVE